jgi:hypothetical protein
MIPVSKTVTSTSATTSSTHSRTSYYASTTQDTVRHELTDDGLGSFGPLGTINYASRTLNVRFVQKTLNSEGYNADHEDASAFENSTMTEGGGSGSGSGGGSGGARKGGDYSTSAVGEEMLAASTVFVTYAETFVSPQTHSQTYSPPTVTIDLAPQTKDYIVPNSVQFVWMGEVFQDFDGVMVRGRSGNNPGIVCGQLDYSAGVCRLFDYTVNGSPSNFTLESLWTVRQIWTTASIFLRTLAAPVKPNGWVMNLSDAQGNSITATAGLDGLITGTHLRGIIDYLTGTVELQFGDYVLDTDLTPAQRLEWWYNAADIGAVQPLRIWRPWPVDPTTLRYNSVTYFYLPIDAEILGLDPVRLPQDGRAPMYRPGGYVVVLHTATIPPATLSNGQTINAARVRLARMRVIGANGVPIVTGHTTDLDAGTLTVTDVAGWVQPVTIEHTIEQLARTRDVQINGDIGIVGQLTHDFPVGSIVASALAVPGNLRARVSALWDQATWNAITWSDTIVGDPAPGTYNDALAPIVTTNAGALTERFALRFLTSTTFTCTGENVGVIGTGSINVNFAPVNPISGAPYFELLAIGWGAGWAAGNTVFLHTVGAIYAFAQVRTVQMGPALGTDYSYEVLGRGDVDRPPTL